LREKKFKDHVVYIYEKSTSKYHVRYIAPLQGVHGCCPNLLLKVKLTAKNEKLISLAKTNFHKTYGQMIGQVCDISIREVHIQDIAQSFESLAYFSPDCSGSVIGVMHV